MIRILGLTKRFDEKEAISSLSLEIGPGITGLVGQNGAGKSTLFRLISGVYEADEGEIFVDSFFASTKESKERIFFLPDDPFSPPNSDIKGTLDFYKVFYDVDIEKFYRLVEQFRLPKGVKIRKFSKGMRRLLFIALALSINVSILLLDEAFDGLDPLVLEIVKAELLKIYDDQEKTIVISSHNISALEKLVDKFIIIHEGKLRSDGTIDYLGDTFVKYQAIFQEECSEEILTKHGLDVITYRKIGSISNFVINKKENLDVEKVLEDLKPTLLENIPIDANEIIILQMTLARKEKKDEK